MSKPLISVIIPVYKTEKYLERCVDSVRNQTYRNLEIILVDDGSPDRCGEMCDTYAKQDSRIRVTHKENGGQASARNRGIDVANGEYIGFVDADDFVDAEMYTLLYGNLIRTNAQIACCGVTRVDENGAYRGCFNETSENGVLVYNRNDAMAEHLNNTRITSSLCDKLFCRVVFEGIRMIEGMIFEDLEVLPRCIASAQTICYTSAALYFYVMTARSTLRGEFGVRQFDAMQAGRMRLEFYQREFPEYTILAKDAYVEICLHLISESWGSHDCDAPRVEAVHEVLKYRDDYAHKRFRAKTRMKMLILRLGTPVYSITMKCYHKLARLARDKQT